MEESCSLVAIIIALYPLLTSIRHVSNEDDADEAPPEMPQDAVRVICVGATC